MTPDPTPVRSRGAKHDWRFFRAGGLDQVDLATGEDLEHLEELDPKLWVALSCPTRGLDFDARTLELIDTDGDGRIRVPEVVAAVAWARARLRNPADLFQGADGLPLAAINDSTPEGRELLASARRILEDLGKAEMPVVTVADTTDTARIFSQTPFNGDGVVPPEAAAEEEVRAVMADILDCLGGEVDRSGKPGVDRARADRFFGELQAHSDWWQKAEETAAVVFPLGDVSASAYAALQAVRPKVDDYFARCRLAAFDPRAGPQLNPAEADFAALATRDLSVCGEELAHFPLARVEAGRPLPLGEGLNPAWDEAMERFRRDVVTPVLGEGKTALTREEWAEVKSRFAGYEAWVVGKAGASVEKLGLPRVREILAGGARETINALIAEDLALAPEMDAITDVDRLARYFRDLSRFLHNFVSFSDFYSERRKAVFQAGTLYLDGRGCELCVRVDDAGKHAALAALARTYLAYCDCTRRGSAEKITIAAAFTGGDSDNLMVGRNGVFYDRQGRDWDATIIRIVEHPISIRQAILSPYKRMGRMVGDQIQKLAASRDQAIRDRVTADLDQAAKGTEQGKSPAGAKQSQGNMANMVGVLAAIGLALGAIGTAVATAASAFFRLPWWQMPLAVLGLLVLVSGPSVVSAWLKLRQRNLGPILDASGWAVNGRVKVNIPFGGALTATVALPRGTVRALRDPYASRGGTKAVLWLLVLLATAFAAAALYSGGFEKVLRWLGL